MIWIWSGWRMSRLRRFGRYNRTRRWNGKRIKRRRVGWFGIWSSQRIAQRGYSIAATSRAHLLQANGRGRAYQTKDYAHSGQLLHGFHAANSHRCVSGSLKESKDLGFCGGWLEGDEGGDDMDESHEGAGKFVVASGDAPKLFDAAKESLHFLTHSVFLFVIRKEPFPTCSRRG